MEHLGKIFTLSENPSSSRTFWVFLMLPLIFSERPYFSTFPLLIVTMNPKKQMSLLNKELKFYPSLLIDMCGQDAYHKNFFLEKANEEPMEAHAPFEFISSKSSSEDNPLN